MRGAAPLALHAFDAAGDPLERLQGLPQGQYLRWYLADLGAKSVLVEPAYFDRDYLSEFAAFYCTSVAGYENVCQRAHYFDCEVDRGGLERAVAGDAAEQKRLRAAYLGFIVVRPIPATPIGRTVLAAYPDKTPDLPRVVEPFRTYRANVAGLELDVDGIAWQQQDAAVGACATIALWSMLHSSAFDDRHVVPTTADVTRTAHGPGLSAQRPFPSRGLNLGQLVATVRDSGFAPLVIPGDAGDRFSREHFNTSLTAFVRSGYPAVIAGTSFDSGPGGREIGGHAVCAVGFRQASARVPSAGSLDFEDAETEYVYLHDDNLGPTARFRVETDSDGSVLLRASPPAAIHALSLPDPTKDHAVLRPSALLAAAHEDVRLSPDTLHARAVELGSILIAATGKSLGLSVSSRITRLPRYVQRELPKVGLAQEVLGRTRLALWESVPPMSLHLGVVRFGVGDQPLVDILFDTTDSAPNLRAFCHVVYHPQIASLISHVVAEAGVDFGVPVAAF